MTSKNKSFFFIAYRQYLYGPKVNNDMVVSFHIDQDEKESLAPFALLNGYTRLKVTVEVIE